MYLLISLFLILGKYIPDALYDNGKKTLAGNIRWGYMFLTSMIVLAWFNFAYPEWLHSRVFDYVKLIVGFCLLWFAIGDATYNLTRRPRLPLFYIGTTKQPDIFLQWFFKVTKFPHGVFLLTLKGIALIWALAWLLIQNP